MSGSCLVVMYHYVRDTSRTSLPGIRALAPDLFAQQLDWLQDQYNVITPQTFQAAVDGEGVVPDNAALLTFDDGFVDHFETVFPVLRARGLSGVFFLSQAASGAAPRLLAVHQTHLLLAALGSEAFGRAVLAECASGVSALPRGRGVFGVDRWEEADDRAVKHLINYELPFTEAERVLDALCRRHLGDPAALASGLYLREPMVREMARGGMVFGYHTRTHRMLSRLSVEDQRQELAGGVDWIRAMTGQDSIPFCYPWGGVRTYTSDTVRLLRDTGYALAFNTVRRRARPGVDDRFEIPRFDTRDLPPYTRGEVDAAAAAALLEDA
jgi:peptidoglycan/xylan/chitin deacetylase (PgdA/CDA1 family)